MHRLTALLLLVAAFTAQTPLICLAGMHPPAVATESAAYAHHGQHEGHAVRDVAGNPGMEARVTDDAGTVPPSDESAPCAALMRCQTSALPESGGAAMDAAQGSEPVWNRVGLQPSDAAPAESTPPPR